jgi:hypothetical protein
LLHRNDREFYIGDYGTKKELKANRIDLSYFNSDVPCVYIYNGIFPITEPNGLPIGSLIIEVETNESGTV